MEDVISSIAMLCRWIEGKNKELGRFMVSPGGEKKAPTGFNFKQISEEDRAFWADLNMNFYSCGLGGVASERCARLYNEG